jgi:membrane protease YdiL (CAAX protease family)
MESILRPFWNRFFNFNWKFGFFLILISCIPRLLMFLNTGQSGTCKFISLTVIMVLTAAAPFLFLKKKGRKAIGISKPVDYNGVLLACIFGLTVSILFFTLGVLLYSTSQENWYSYIMNPYAIPNGINPGNSTFMISMMALLLMTVSTIGEELFFRGIIHSSFARSIGNNKASVIGSLVFVFTYIAHFALMLNNFQYTLAAVPCVVLGLGMFIVSILFLLFKKFSGSLLGAVICHLSFNFGMLYCTSCLL